MLRLAKARLLATAQLAEQDQQMANESSMTPVPQSQLGVEPSPQPSVHQSMGAAEPASPKISSPAQLNPEPSKLVVTES